MFGTLPALILLFILLAISIFGLMKSNAASNKLNATNPRRNSPQ